jgi:hypothetical protein
MSNMSNTTVISLATARDRGRRVARAVDASRKLRRPGDRRMRTRATGRAWLNGSELGAPREALLHLAESYD